MRIACQCFVFINCSTLHYLRLAILSTYLSLWPVCPFARLWPVLELLPSLHLAPHYIKSFVALLIYLLTSLTLCSTSIDLTATSNLNLTALGLGALREISTQSFVCLLP